MFQLIDWLKPYTPAYSRIESHANNFYHYKRLKYLYESKVESENNLKYLPRELEFDSFVDYTSLKIFLMEEWMRYAEDGELAVHRRLRYFNLFNILLNARNFSAPFLRFVIGKWIIFHSDINKRGFHYIANNKYAKYKWQRFCLPRKFFYENFGPIDVVFKFKDFEHSNYIKREFVGNLIDIFALGKSVTNDNFFVTVSLSEGKLKAYWTR